jgi:hypothetical protein
MFITKAKFNNQLIVLPNTKYLFGEVQSENDLNKVIRTFDCAEIATIYITSVGTFGFAFHDSSNLASIDALQFRGEGRIPEDVLSNEEEIHNLQEARILFINFVSAAFFGRVSGKENCALVGATYNGQDRVAGFEVMDGKALIRYTDFIARALKDKNSELNARSSQAFLLADGVIDDAISYVQHLLQRENDFECVDLKQCMTMNYQAAILHSQQHAAASLALNFSVLESLVREICYAYGLVNGSSPKQFATKTHNVSKISKSQFDDMKLGKLTEILHAGGLFDTYLYQEITKVRKLRNNLMHGGTKVDPRNSGTCQTIVRDLWGFLIDSPFELNAGWSYLR